MKPATLPALAGLLLLCLSAAARADEAKSDTQAPAWKPAQRWRLVVEEYPPPADDNQKAAEPAVYSVLVLVNGVTLAGGQECWCLWLFPGPEAPKRLKQRYRLDVGKATGWTYKAEAFVNSQAFPLALEKLDAASFVARDGAGVPAEFFPLPRAELFEASDKKTKLTVRKQGEGKAITLEATFAEKDRPEVVIRQRWAEGEAWWREHERYEGGRKVLRARVSNDPVPQAAPIPPAPPPAPDSAAVRFPLRYDPRLHVPVPVEADRPSLDDLLGRLRLATGLTLTVDPGLAEHQPLFGTMRLSKTRAWGVMELIAERQLVEGRWEKAEGGYRLTAKASLSAKAREDAAKHTGRAPQPDPFPLRSDPKLRARLTVYETDPPLPVLLERLQKATGLGLALDPSLAEHDPTFGSVQY